MKQNGQRVACKWDGREVRRVFKIMMKDRGVKGEDCRAARQNNEQNNEWQAM